jgi:large subunit ribosomal protein L9
MKVVFIEDVEGVAQGGQVKEVKPGFARNYLIPKNLAVPATHDSLQQLAKLRNQAEKGRTEKLNDMTAIGKRLDGLRLDIEMSSGPGGRLYGSVTTAIIATKLSELLGTTIDRRIIVMPESIRNIGSFTSKIKLHAEVIIDIEILVHPTDIDPEAFIQQLAAQELDPDEVTKVEIDTDISEIDDSVSEVDGESSENEDTELQDEEQAESKTDSDTVNIVDEIKS